MWGISWGGTDVSPRLRRQRTKKMHWMAKIFGAFPNQVIIFAQQFSHFLPSNESCIRKIAHVTCFWILMLISSSFSLWFLCCVSSLLSIKFSYNVEELVRACPQTFSLTLIWMCSVKFTHTVNGTCTVTGTTRKERKILENVSPFYCVVDYVCLLNLRVIYIYY